MLSPTTRRQGNRLIEISVIPFQFDRRALPRFYELFQGFSSSVSGVIYSPVYIAKRRKSIPSLVPGGSFHPQIGLRLAASALIHFDFRGEYPMNFPFFLPLFLCFLLPSSLSLLLLETAETPLHTPTSHDDTSRSFNGRWMSNQRLTRAT